MFAAFVICLIVLFVSSVVTTSMETLGKVGVANPVLMAQQLLARATFILGLCACCMAYGLAGLLVLAGYYLVGFVLSVVAEAFLHSCRNLVGEFQR